MTKLLESLTAYPSFGEMLALSSGLVWAIAVILFRISGRRVHPIGLNLAKCLLALVIIIPTLAVPGEPPPPARAADAHPARRRHPRRVRRPDTVERREDREARPE